MTSCTDRKDARTILASARQHGVSDRFPGRVLFRPAGRFHMTEHRASIAGPVGGRIGRRRREWCVYEEVGYG